MCQKALQLFRLKHRVALIFCVWIQCTVHLTWNRMRGQVTVLDNHRRRTHGHLHTMWYANVAGRNVYIKT